MRNGIRKESNLLLGLFDSFSESAHVELIKRFFTEICCETTDEQIFTFMLRHFSTEMKCDFVGVFSFCVSETGFFFSFCRSGHHQT